MLFHVTRNKLAYGTRYAKQSKTTRSPDTGDEMADSQLVEPQPIRTSFAAYLPLPESMTGARRPVKVFCWQK
jgi:hypothetical protein